MQNNGNKLRAFIITFIIMGLLIVAGYFIFKNMKSDNTTKGDSLGKKFTSLFGLSKQTSIDISKDVALPGSDTINNSDNTNTNGVNPDGTMSNPSNNTQGSGSTTNGSTTTNQGVGSSATPKLNPFPYSGVGSYLGGGFTGGGFTGGGSGFTGGGVDTGGGGYGIGDIITTKTQCNDGIDNDKDGKIDKADAGCHTDLKATNASSYFAGWDDETSENDPIAVDKDKNKNKCEVNVVFNDTDKARLEELSRMFYRLAPNLATEEDIKLEVANQKNYTNVIGKAKEYTAQCYKERETLGPSRALINGKDFMLESRKTAYANTTKIAPSETFLPGDKGESFKKPYITISNSYRSKYFEEVGTGKDKDLVINKGVIKTKDRGEAAGTIAAHILQYMHDFGIIKRYIPGKPVVPIPSDVLWANNQQNADKMNAFKGDENYEKVLKILLRETGKYLDTLAAGRQEWSDRQGGDKLESFVGFVSENNSDFWGYVKVKEALNLYLASSDNDDTRKVDYGKITHFSGASEFETTPVNAYKTFEDAWNVW